MTLTPLIARLREATGAKYVMSRRRFSEREVLETLIIRGVVIPCFRCQEPLEVGQRVEREHVHEIKLDGPDVPGNCAYSHAACHKVVTHGNGHTVAGSSRHRIAKATEATRIDKFQVRKLDIDQPRPPKRQFGRRSP